ncbi:hypothetical protein KCU95_g1148, partial [Aureobasidium melanogenum]
MPLFISHSPERPIDKQSLVQDNIGVTSFPRPLSKQPVFRAYSRGSAPPSLSQFDKNTADEQADSNAKKAVVLDQTKSAVRTQIGPHIEDDIPISITQDPPKTPTSRVPSRTSKKILSPYFARTRSQPTQQTMLELPRCESNLSQRSQTFREHTIRVPIETRWSNTRFKFTPVTFVSTVPAPVIKSIKK